MQIKKKIKAYACEISNFCIFGKLFFIKSHPDINSGPKQKQNMKKISTLLIPVFFTMVLVLSAQAPRTVLFEEFTSATCPPCATTNPIFMRFLQPFGDKVINVAFQCNIPVVGDPMYASNTTEVNTRMTYYGINSAPNCRMDGKVPAPGSTSPTHPLNVTATILNNRLAVTSPIELHVDHVVILGTGGAKDSMDITIDIKNVSNADFGNANYVLQTCLVEELIKFPKQAATNGEFEFHTVMRKMIPSAAGAKFTDILAAGTSKQIKYRAAVPAYIYSYKELAVVAYMQNNLASSKEVIQAGMSHPKAINGVYYDVAISETKLANKVDDCDNTVGFEVILENKSSGGDTIKAINLIPVVAGTNRAKNVWKGTLLPGEKTTYKFGGSLAFQPGSTTYAIQTDSIFTNISNVKDIDALNNFNDAKRSLTLKTTAGGTSIKQNFELPVGNTNAPNGTVFANEGVAVNKRDSSYFRNNSVDPDHGLGGLGLSRYSVFFEFWNAIGADAGSILFDKLDLTNTKNTKIGWSYAYAVNDINSPEKLELLVSTDCGSTWKSEFSKEGSELKTCDPNINGTVIPGFFIPRPEEWITEIVDLSKYDGLNDVYIRFKASKGPAYNWGIFLDDVNVSSTVATTDPGIINYLSVSPNPATDVLNIKINMEESASSNINLTDLNGKVVRTMVKSLTAGQNIITMNVDQIPGVYILEVKTEKGVRTEKVSIF